MPSWRDLERFCNNDNWELWKSTDHFYYRTEDENGNIRHTKISRGSGEIPKKLWQVILKRQLQVSKEYFNSKM